MTASRRLRLGATLALVAALALIGARATAGPARAAWHRAQGKIAFWDFMSGQIYTVNANGSDLRQLTHTTGGVQAMFPNFSPNGKLIAFSLGNSTHPWRIWVMHADGSHQRRLTTDTKGFRDSTPVYTPDGRAIVFSRCLPGDGVCAIWKMNADGTHKRALTPYIPGGVHERVDFVPAVSPNGKGLKALTPNRFPHNDVIPSYSPDGKWVAFSSDRRYADGCCLDLFEMRADGSGEHKVKLKLHRAGIIGPVWQP